MRSFGEVYVFQLLPCSNCRRTFSLRQDVPEDSWLKCPNCGHQFCLRDTLDAFYAPWQVIPAPGASPNEANSDIAPLDDSGLTPILESDDELPALPADEQELQLSLDASTADELPSSSLGDDEYEAALQTDPEPLEFDQTTGEHADRSTSSAETPSSFDQPRSSAVKSRARSSKGPSIWSLIQIMLGGAASIPVTLLLLWYVVGKDVMNAGPRIAQFAPWIVPSKFHSPSMPEVSVRPSRPAMPPPAPGESGFRNFDDVLPMDGDKLAAPASENKTNESAPTEEHVQPVETDTTMTELFATVASVKQKIAQYDTQETNTTTIVSKITAIMDDLALIGDRLAEVPADGGAVKLLRNDLKDIGRALTANPALEAAFKSGVRAQFNGVMKRNSAGRVYLGLASQVSDSQDKWLMQYTDAQAGKGGYELTANVMKAVAPKLEAGARVFIIGKLVAADKESQETAPHSAEIEAFFLQTL